MPSVSPWAAAGTIEIAGTDPRVDAAVALAPVFTAAAADVTIPLQIQIGSEDCMVPADITRLLYEAVPGAPKQFLELAGANHIGYVDQALAAVGGFLITEVLPIDCPPRITYAEQHRVSTEYATMWFDAHLYGTDAWADELFGSGVQADLAAGVLSELRIDQMASHDSERSDLNREFRAGINPSPTGRGDRPRRRAGLTPARALSMERVGVADP